MRAWLITELVRMARIHLRFAMHLSDTTEGETGRHFSWASNESMARHVREMHDYVDGGSWS